MRILITGAKGQLGYHLKEVFSRDTLYLADVDNLDIINASALERVFREFKPELVLHCAAYTAVDRAEQEPTKSFAVNRDGTANLAEHARAHGIPILIISTDYVFDGRTKRPYQETANPKPLSVYGASKLAGEQVVLSRCPKHWIVRTAWLYGGGSHHRNFVRTMLELARKTKQLNVVNDQIGSPTYAADLAEAIKTIVSKPLPYGTWHIANTGKASWYDLAHEILKIKNIKRKLRPIKSHQLKRKAVRPVFSVLSTAKAERYGIKLRSWQEALGDFLSHERG